MNIPATVSVIVPVYNVGKYVREAIQSVLNQTFTDIEIIIVDDGSTDNSIEICKQFSDSRIKIIQQSNRGLAGARNTGIRYASGKYIALLDSDDAWAPQKLEKHVIHLNSCPHVGVSFSRSELMGENGVPLGSYLMPKINGITVADLFRANMIGNGSAAVIRKKVLESIKFQGNLYGEIENYYFDENFRRNEDIELWLRIAIQSTWIIEGIPDALTLYRINPSGLSANLIEQLKSWEQVLEKIKRYAPEVMRQFEQPARAYHMRYLARNGLRLEMPKESLKLVSEMLEAYWKILIEQPYPTFPIILGVCLLNLLPRSTFSTLYGYVSSKKANHEKRVIMKEL